MQDGFQEEWKTFMKKAILKPRDLGDKGFREGIQGRRDIGRRKLGKKAGLTE